MVLLTHVLIAIASMALTTYQYAAPSQKGLRASQGLVALTLVSGTYLVLSTNGNMLRACVSGLVYLAIVSVGLFAASRKLNAVEEI